MVERGAGCGRENVSKRLGGLCRGRVLLFATNKNIKTAVEVVSSSSFFDVSKRLRFFMEFDIFQFPSRLVSILLLAKKKLFFILLTLFI